MADDQIKDPIETQTPDGKEAESTGTATVGSDNPVEQAGTPEAQASSQTPKPAADDQDDDLVHAVFNACAYDGVQHYDIGDVKLMTRMEYDSIYKAVADIEEE